MAPDTAPEITPDATPAATRPAFVRWVRSRTGRIVWGSGSLILVALVAVLVVTEFSQHSTAAEPAPSAAVASPSPSPTPARTMGASAAVEGAEVTLGAIGGEAELDRCDDTFTQQVAYGADLPPVWAAHNDCGGDVILPMQVGQEVTVSVDGVPTAYVVVDTRDTRKQGATVEDIAGIPGPLVLQTCYYDIDKMKFLSLAPASSSTGAAATPAG